MQKYDKYDKILTEVIIMYNFKMTKERSNEILENCNFNDFEKKLFNCLISTRTRKEVYEQFE